jgi:hypothetical protein
MSKELIGYDFEFFWWKKAGGSAIILVHCLAYFDRQTHRTRNGLCCLYGFGFSACYDLRCSSQPTSSYQRQQARSTNGTQAP